MIRVSTAGALIAAAAFAVPQASRAEIRIRHVAVVDVDAARIDADREVVIRGGRIATIRPDAGSRRRADDIEGRGLFLSPGLWDAHTHLSYLGRCALPQFVAAGVTSVRDLGSRSDDVARWRRDMRRGVLTGPRIASAGANLESTE